MHDRVVEEQDGVSPWSWLWWRGRRSATQRKERFSTTMKRTQTLVHLLDTKTITMFGGLTLLFNNMTGPGIPQTQSIFQQSGSAIVTICFATFGVISTLCSLFIVEAMQAIPGNKDFQGTVEFGTLIHFYFGKWAHIAGQICLYAALISNAVASFIQSVQTLDNMIMDIVNTTCGVSFSPNFGVECVSVRSSALSPFGDDYMLVTYGFCLAIILLVPLLCIEFSDSIWIQAASFALTMAIFVQWIGAAFYNGVSMERVPAIGQAENFSGLVAIVMLDFAYVGSVPSWINIKKSDASVQKTLWLSAGTGCLAYIMIGFIPALAYDIPPTTNLISVMAATSKFNRAIGYLFSLIILFPSIPVFLSIARSNLAQNFKLNKYQLISICYICPLLSTIPMLTGSYLTSFNIWTSLIFVSTANFVVPLLIYLKATDFRKKYNETRELTAEQKALLKIIHWQSKTIGRFIDSYDIIKERMLETRRSSLFLSSFQMSTFPAQALPFRKKLNNCRTSIGDGSVSSDKKRPDQITRSTSTVHIGVSAMSLVTHSPAAGRSLGNVSLSPLSQIIQSSTEELSEDSIPVSTTRGSSDGLASTAEDSASKNLGSSATIIPLTLKSSSLQRSSLNATFGDGYHSDPPAIALIPPSACSSVVKGTREGSTDGPSNVIAESSQLSLDVCNRLIFIDQDTPNAIDHGFDSKKNKAARSEEGLSVVTDSRSHCSVSNSSSLNPIFKIEQFLLDDVPDPDFEDAELRAIEEMQRISQDDHSFHGEILVEVSQEDCKIADDANNKKTFSRHGTSGSLFGFTASLHSIFTPPANSPLRANLPFPSKPRGGSRARMGSAKSKTSQLSDLSAANSGLARIQSADSMGRPIAAATSVAGTSSYSLNTSLGSGTAGSHEGSSFHAPHLLGAISGVPSVIVEEVASPSNDALKPTSLMVAATTNAQGIPSIHRSASDSVGGDQNLVVEYVSRSNSLTVNQTAATGPTDDSNNESRPNSVKRISVAASSGHTSEASTRHRASFPKQSPGGAFSQGLARQSNGVNLPSLHQNQLLRRRSLPAHPDFVSKSFRSVPRWVPIKAKTLAMICLVITIAATIGDLIFNSYVWFNAN